MFKIALESFVGDFVYLRSRLTGLSVGRASANAIRAEDRWTNKEKSKEHYDRFAADVNQDARNKTSKLFRWFVVKDWRNSS